MVYFACLSWAFVKFCVCVFPFGIEGRTRKWVVIVLIPGPGCSKLTTSLVNVSLKFQTLISEICQYFLLKKCEKLLQCKGFSKFFNKNIMFLL